MLGSLPAVDARGSWHPGLQEFFMFRELNQPFSNRQEAGTVWPYNPHLSEQFDAVMHIDETHALEPLETWSFDEADLPETYPTAL
jgi:hypothetical protein